MLKIGPRYYSPPRYDPRSDTIFGRFNAKDDVPASLESIRAACRNGVAAHEWCHWAQYGGTTIGCLYQISYSIKLHICAGLALTLSGHKKIFSLSRDDSRLLLERTRLKEPLFRASAPLCHSGMFMALRIFFDRQLRFESWAVDHEDVGNRRMHFDELLLHLNFLLDSFREPENLPTLLGDYLSHIESLRSIESQTNDEPIFGYRQDPPTLFQAGTKAIIEAQALCAQIIYLKKISYALSTRIIYLKAKNSSSDMDQERSDVVRKNIRKLARVKKIMRDCFVSNVGNEVILWYIREVKNSSARDISVLSDADLSNIISGLSNADLSNIILICNVSLDPIVPGAGIINSTDILNIDPSCRLERLLRGVRCGEISKCSEILSSNRAKIIIGEMREWMGETKGRSFLTSVGKNPDKYSCDAFLEKTRRNYINHQKLKNQDLAIYLSGSASDRLDIMAAGGFDSDIPLFSHPVRIGSYSYETSFPLDFLWSDSTDANRLTANFFVRTALIYINQYIETGDLDVDLEYYYPSIANKILDRKLILSSHFGEDFTAADIISRIRKRVGHLQ